MYSGERTADKVRRTKQAAAAIARGACTTEEAYRRRWEEVHREVDILLPLGRVQFLANLSEFLEAGVQKPVVTLAHVLLHQAGTIVHVDGLVLKGVLKVWQQKS